MENNVINLTFRFKGMCYIQGQLMKSEIGSAYIDFNDKSAYTIGELYLVNFYCLLRINHLESTSGEFPAGYDINPIKVWPYKLYFIFGQLTSL